jgi:hypothetical protein
MREYSNMGNVAHFFQIISSWHMKLKNDLKETCKIPQIWVLTYARPWSLSQGSWNRAICARHMGCIFAYVSTQIRLSSTHFFEIICRKSVQLKWFRRNVLNLAWFEYSRMQTQAPKVVGAKSRNFCSPDWMLHIPRPLTPQSLTTFYVICTVVELSWNR